jgi:RAD51-like protein 2
MRLGARNGVSYIVTMQLSTKLQNQDGTSANFDTGAKAVMVPALGKPTVI